MTTPVDNSLLTARQERRWFRVWTASLIIFFTVVGTASLGFLWTAKHAQAVRHRQLLNAAEPDPGVTTPEDTSIKQAAVIQVGVYVDRVPELSIRDATWTIEFDVWFRWRGNQPNPAERLVVIEATIESKEKLAEFHRDGNHYERYRVVARVTKLFPAAQMPFDSHLLLLAMENGESSRATMVFVPDLENISVSSRVSIPGYRIAHWQALEKPHSYKTTRGDPRMPSGTKSTYSQFRVGILIERNGWGLYWKLFQALHIAVVIAFLSCFIKPTDVDPRFGLGVGALFAAVANSYVVNSLIPDTGEFSAADVINGLGILTIMVTLIESTVSLYLYDRCGEHELSQRLDQTSFKILIGGFTVVNVLLFVTAVI